MNNNISYLNCNKELKLKKFSCLITAVIIFIAALDLSAQIGSQTSKTGTTAAQFLKISVGPRAIGMGGAFTAVADDINSFYWNPAGISKIYSSEAYFNHVDWIADVNLDYAGFAMNIPSLGTLGAFVSVLSMGEEKVRTVEMPEGTGEVYDAGSLLLGLSFARKLTEEFSIGFNVKYIREYIWNESDAVIAFDIGTSYTIPFLNKFTIAASIANFGSKMRMEGRDIRQTMTTGEGDANLITTNLELDAFDLPLLFRIGAAVDAISTLENRLTFAVDALHPNDHSESISTGLEYAWNETFFIRGGMKNLFERDGEQGFTVGVGVNYRLIEAIRIKVDYAYQDFGRLANVQYFSLGVNF